MKLVQIIKVLTAVFLLTLVTSYLIAVLDGDVRPILPYISDTGTVAPESCIFGQMLNLSAVLFAVVVYFRWLQVRQYIALQKDIADLTPYNNVAMAAGLAAAFGVSMVANFQELSMPVLHVIGAGIAFGLPVVFMVAENFISYRTIVYGYVSRKTAIARTVIGVIYVPTGIIFLAMSLIAGRFFHGDNRLQWGPEDGGYVLHLVGGICEWLMAFEVIGYIATYASEFSRTKIAEPVVTVTSVDDEPLIMHT